MTKRNLYTAGAVVAVLVALVYAEKGLDNAAQAQGKEAPMFEVDPFWPKPLPNHWILGSTIGIGVDSRDHIYIIHRRDTFNERTLLDLAGFDRRPAVTAAADQRACVEPQVGLLL